MASVEKHHVLALSLHPKLGDTLRSHPRQSKSQSYHCEKCSEQPSPSDKFGAHLSQLVQGRHKDQRGLTRHPRHNSGRSGSCVRRCAVIGRKELALIMASSPARPCNASAFYPRHLIIFGFSGYLFLSRIYFTWHLASPFQDGLAFSREGDGP